jgi:uncharacterized membrane protein
MNPFFGNLDWMLLNIGLALLGVFFAQLAFRSKGVIRLISLFLWFLFVPNTIYLLTDIEHLPPQLMHVDFITAVSLFLEYFGLIFIGVFTFVISLYPVQVILNKIIKNKDLVKLLFFLFNFLIAFGVNLGKIQRVHSIEVITNSTKVFRNILEVGYFSESLYFVLFFGILINVIYFYFINNFSVQLKKAYE